MGVGCSEENLWNHGLQQINTDVGRGKDKDRDKCKGKSKELTRRGRRRRADRPTIDECILRGRSSEKHRQECLCHNCGLCLLLDVY